ncbi:ABC transporter substrate binding protein [Arcobacter sp. 15-2]|uniref:sensor histidine kinase n=1 Tax=Arcobacter sp. 15-2 TaxID=3374109 RepID=UPI00399CAC21
MKNKLILLLFLSSIIYGKEVLLLHSYHKAYEWTDSISEAIEDSLQYSNVEITTEYMDTKRIYSEDYIESLYTFYKKKYQNRKFDVIIASDNNALEFLNTYHDQIFQDTPIVFCGINNFNKQAFQKYNIKKRTTGVVEEVDIEKNLNLILKLHPNLSKLLVINDTTTTGKEMKKEFFKAYEKHKNEIEVEYIDSFEIAKLQKKVTKLDKNSVILFMLLHRDDTGKVFTFKDGLKKIEKKSDVPIYGLWDFYLNRGLVGGFVTHSDSQGELAGKMVRYILKGKKVTDIPIIEKSPNSYIFDYHKLKKFGLEFSSLPDESIIANKPQTFYANYETELSIIAVTFIFFTIIIFMLIDSVEDKRKARNELQIQLNFIETLLNTMKNPIFYKDKDGKYVGCNDAFCKFIGQDKEEIIGKTMYHLFKNQIDFCNTHENYEKKLFNREKVDDYVMDYKLNDNMKTIIVSKDLYLGAQNKVAGTVTILHDITELIKIQNEKKQHESFLSQQSKLAEIGEMINAIAHQWNEPLVEMSAIVQDLELQYNMYNISDEDMKLFVKDAMVQIQYMSKTLKDFRDFLKPSAKKSNFFIENAFNEILNIIERQMKYSYLELNIQYKGPDLIVYGYKNEFMQVLIAILNNSKDAILQLKKRELNYKGKIDVIVSSKNDIVEILIIDNGAGINIENKDSLFHAYYSTKDKGNGLGLYMSRILIQDKMDGKIYFKDTKDVTTLTIELPKRQKNENLIT